MCLIIGPLSVHSQVKVDLSTLEYAESSPRISFDGTRLVYSSNQAGSWQIYETSLTDLNKSDSWDTPKKIEVPGISPGVGMVITDPVYNHNGSRIYFSANFQTTNGGMDIYYIERLDNGWSSPVNVSTKINTFIDELAPMLSADENNLFFVRKYPAEKKNEFYHRIYFSHKKTDGSWGDPIMASTTINFKDENYPFFAADNKLLIFSSKRLEEPEGYNLFASKRYAENIWSQPELIANINSASDDISPSMAANSDILFYSQYFDKKKVVTSDIYSSRVSGKTVQDSVFIITGQVLDKESEVPLKATVLMRYRDNMEIVSRFETSGVDGKYIMFQPRGRDVEIEVSKTNYSHAFVNIKMTYDQRIPVKPESVDFKLFNTAKLILNVFDKEIFEPLESTIQVTDDKQEALPQDQLSYLPGGRVVFNLAIGSTYQINIKSKNYDDYNFTFDLKGVVQFDEFEKDAEMSPSKSAFEINIADVETDESMDEVEIVITNLDKNETIVKRVRKGEDGKFMVDLRDGDKYEINVNGPKGYAFYNTKVDMSDTENKKLDVKLQPLKAKTKLVLNDITFETNSADLNASSFQELDRVVKLLQDNPEIKIEISAHTDNIGSDDYNFKLSAKRAQSVVDYLVANKLQVDRFIAKGYGESMPVSANDTEENRAKNRRVELKIVDITEETKKP